MKRTFKIIMALSLALCLILPCLIITAQGDGKITVIIKNDEQKLFSGISVNLCQIASANEEGDFVYTYDFSTAGIDLLQQTDTDIADEAELLYEYIIKNKIAYTTLKTGSNGKCTFTSLEDGIYLVFGNSGESVTFDPYLIVMPMYEDGAYVYDVESTPKMMEDSGGGGSEDYTSVSVTKVWDDNSNSANLRPSGVVVTLYRDGIAYKRVTLSASNTWKYTFTNLPVGSEYTVKEENTAPYTPSYSGDASTGYVITNTYSTEKPTEGTTEEPTDDRTEDYTNPKEDSTEPPETQTEAPTEAPTEEYGHVTVTKKWNYSGTNRPTYVTVQLIENGVVVQTAVLSDENDWTYTFTELPMTNTYTVKEIKPTGFTASYSGNASSGIIVTNKKKSSGGGGDEPVTEPPTSEEDTDDTTTEPTGGDGTSTEPTQEDNTGGNDDDSTEATTEKETGSHGDKPTESSKEKNTESDDDPTKSPKENGTGGTDNPQQEDDSDEEEVIPIPTKPEPNIKPTENPSDYVPGEYTTDEPIIPQTGDNILICYVLCIAGAVLVLMGLVLLITGREKR